MKKLLFLTIFITSLFGDAKVYTGVSYGAFNETFYGTNNTSVLTNSIKAKIGYGIRESYAIELAVEYTKNKENIFSDVGTTDGDKLGFNIEFLKAFDLDIYINPFFKAGFGAGSFSIEKQSKVTDKLSYGSFNLGGGIFIPIDENFDIEIGYEYRYMTYENFDTATTSENRGPVFQSHVNVGYIGFNVRF